MQWDSWEAFVSMGGAGLYVWGSYAVTLVLMVAESVVVHRRHREARRQLAALARSGRRP